MSRIIRAGDTPATRRHAHRRSAAEALRLLAGRPALAGGYFDAEAKDLVAFLALHLRGIGDTIEGSAQAWDDRNYWKKAEALRDEYRWAPRTADTLEALVVAERWADVVPESGVARAPLRRRDHPDGHARRRPVGRRAPRARPPRGQGGHGHGRVSGLVTKQDGGRTLVLDPVRRRYVALTPEEGVRQTLLADLLALGYPAGLLAVEKGLPYGGKTWRADAVAYARTGEALLLAECKAPGVAVGQATFDQLARYNAVLGASVLVVDNGRVRYCCVRSADGWTFVDAIPPFPA